METFQKLMEGNIALTIVFVVIILITMLLAYLSNRMFLRQIRKSTEELNTDPTNYQFLRYVAIVLIYITGFSIAIYTIPSLRALASSLLAGAGILAVALGFAAQQALSNVISGVFIVAFKPFRVNDRLKIRELTGIVEDITLRHTVIRDFENKRIVIPNSLISEEIIINADFANEQICKWIDVGISYDSDIDLAKYIMEDEVMKHLLHVDPRKPEEIELGLPEVPVRVIALGESSVMIRAWAWAKDSPDAFVLQCDLLESIKKRFDRENVEIALQHRTLVFKNGLPRGVLQPSLP